MNYAVSIIYRCRLLTKYVTLLRVLLEIKICQPRNKLGNSEKFTKPETQLNLDHITFKIWAGRWHPFPILMSKWPIYKRQICSCSRGFGPRNTLFFSLNDLSTANLSVIACGRFNFFQLFRQYDLEKSGKCCNILQWNFPICYSIVT